MFVDNCILRLALWIYKHKGEIRFRDWLRLEGLKEKVIKAVESSSDEFPTLLLDFISTALHVPAKHFQDAEWVYVVQAFYEVIKSLPVIKLPMTENVPDQSKPEDWDYDGRTWHHYSHILASEYGWQLEYISQLRPAEALAKIQEILTDQQLDREFQYSLSEIAYPYNAQTKKSNFKPLERPHWMRPKIKPITRIKMPLAHLPVGNVNYDALPEEFKPQPFVN